MRVEQCYLRAYLVYKTQKEIVLQKLILEIKFQSLKFALENFLFQTASAAVYSSVVVALYPFSKLCALKCQMLSCFYLNTSTQLDSAFL